VDADAPEAEHEPEAPAVPTAPSGSRSFSPLQVAAAVVIVLLVAALVVTQLQLSNANGRTGLTSDQTSAVAAARTYAADVATYDYRHLTQSFAKVEAESTPSFKSSFIKSSNGLSKVLVQYKATATAKVLTAGLVSQTSSQAVVIVFVNQTVANTTDKGTSTTDDSRIKVTVDRSNGRWLLQQLKVL
jgi:Mce-associated membrane protein